MTAEGGTGQLEAASPGTSPARGRCPHCFTHGNEQTCIYTILCMHTTWKKKTRKRQQTRDAAPTSSTLFFFFYQTSLPHSTLKNCCGFFRWVRLVLFIFHYTTIRMMRNLFGRMIHVPCLVQIFIFTFLA